MNDVDAKKLISEYATSYYAPGTAGGWFDENEAARARGDRRRTIDGRACGGAAVPVVVGRELVAAMLANLDEARKALSATAQRLKCAKQDGLMDKEIFATLGKKLRAPWLEAVATVRGDYTQAVSDVAHWQRCAEMASDGRHPTLKASTGAGGTHIVRQLADAKAAAYEPMDDAATNAARRKVADDLARWSAVQEPDRRLPPENDDDVPF